MTVTTMSDRNLSFLLSEGPGQISRAQVTIPSGTGKVPTGTVLGELTATKGSFVPSPDAEVVGIEGAEVAKAILGYAVDATTEDVEVTVFDRDIEAKLPMLAFDASVDDETKIASKIDQLTAVGIRAR
jgi:hypothetical protein